MKVYLHPRHWRRRFTLFYHRILSGRSDERLTTVEKQLLKHFYNMLTEPSVKLEHKVNGVFAKEVVKYHKEGDVVAKFRLLDNTTKVFFFRTSIHNSLVIETFVSAKTILLLNRLYDKEFMTRLKHEREAENKKVREIFGTI